MRWHLAGQTQGCTVGLLRAGAKAKGCCWRLVEFVPVWSVALSVCVYLFIAADLL